MANPTVELPCGASLELHQGGIWGWTWKLAGEPPEDGSWDAELQRAFSIAGYATEEYRYGPADGYPGYGLAQLVANAVGGKAVLPPHPPIPPGAVA